MQPLDGIVRIDLGCRQGAVAEQFLDGIEVRTPVQQFRRQRVAQDVRRFPAADAADLPERRLDRPVHIDRIEARTPRGLQA